MSEPGYPIASLKSSYGQVLLIGPSTGRRYKFRAHTGYMSSDGLIVTDDGTLFTEDGPPATHWTWLPWERTDTERVQMSAHLARKYPLLDK